MGIPKVISFNKRPSLLQIIIVLSIFATSRRDLPGMLSEGIFNPGENLAHLLNVQFLALRELG